MSVPAYLLVPDGREEPGSAVLAVHGHGPGKSRICGLEPDDPPGGRLRRRAGPAWPRGAGAGPAVLRRAAGLEPRGPLRLRHQPGPPGDGRLEPAHPEPVGLRPGSRHAGGPPAGRPGPPRGGRVLLRGDHRPVPGGGGPPGRGGGGERLLLVVGRGPQDALEHVRVPGAPGDAGGHGARRRGRPGRTPGALRRDGPGGPALPGGRGRPSRSARLRRVYGHLGVADRIEHEVGEGEHQWYGQGAYGFLDRHLGGTPAGEAQGGRRVGAGADRVRAARPNRRRGTPWRGVSAGGSTPGTVRSPAREGPATGTALRASGTTARTRPARSSAGTVTVIAVGGTSASVAK